MFDDSGAEAGQGGPPDMENGGKFGRTGGWVVSKRGRNRSIASRLFFAIFLIVAGTLLFLGNIGLLPVRDIWDYWPLALVVVGFGKLLNCRTAGGRVFGVLLIVFGALFLLVTLGIFQIRTHDDSWPLSLLLIAFGVAALMKVLDRGASGKPRVGFAPDSFRSSSDAMLKDAAIFGEVKRKIETVDFRGGEVTSIFGRVELDLRRSLISSADKCATLDVTVVFGAVEIRIPDSWRVDIKGAAILGTFEDKTIPPNRPSADTPTLIITGNAVFGGVEIKD